MSDKSRSKQETLLLEERIEKIRKKNEEIKKRHLEVEADKQNAAKLNALVQITSTSEDWPIGGRSSPPPPHNRGTSRRKCLEPYRSHQNNSSNGSSAKTYSFGEGDGPPPDPKYKFLADSERDSEKNNSDRRQSRPHRGRGNSRDILRDRQYRFGLQKPHREIEQPLPEYDAWRAERIRIDNDRISRQKTAEGQWRREWDHEKITQEEDERLPVRGSKSGDARRSNNWSTNFNQHIKQDYNIPKEKLGSIGFQISERGRGGHVSGSQRVGRGNLHGHRVIQPEQEYSIGNVTTNEGTGPPYAERNVVSVGESIKISVSNDSTPEVKRVKVNAPIVGGTGRVGPRQKIRISYSSQSEDEAPNSRTVEIRSTRVNILSDSAACNSVCTASSKPPLPPLSGYKAEAPRPRRQRVKRVERKKRGEKIYNDNAEESTDKNDDSERGNGSGGDDSWEDVTTTSGNESACEEMSPHNKPEDVVPDTVNDEKLETFDNINDISNSKSYITLTNATHLNETNESIQNNEAFEPQEMFEEHESNLVVKSISSQNVKVNGSVIEFVEENDDYETETVVPADMENESKSEEYNVMQVSSEEKLKAVHE